MITDRNDTARQNEPLSSHPQKFLLMGHLAIGDLLYFLPVLELIKSEYPEMQIDLWTDDLREKIKPWVAERNQAIAALVNTSEAVNTLYPIAEEVNERSQIICQAARVGYDVILFIASGRTAKYANLALSISPEASIYGTKPRRLNDKVALMFDDAKHYRRLAAPPPNCKHISQQYAYYFKQVFCFAEKVLTEPFVYRLSPATELLKKAIDIWGHSRTGFSVFLNGEASNDKKSVSNSYIVNLMCAISNECTGVRFIVNCSPRNVKNTQKELAELISLRDISWEVFSAEHDFLMLPAVIAGSDLVISVDTSTTHIAMGLGKQQVTLLKGTDSPWTPFENAKVLTHPKRAGEIEINRIVNLVAESLAYPSP